jgi:HPt (histidine-containing phosphotransfer) domain-containing protein
MRTSIETQGIFAGSSSNVQTPAGDPAALARLRGWGGEALVRALGKTFVREAGRRIEAARAGAAAGDAEALRGAAHALRSSSGQLGAVSMQALCVRLEAEAARGEVGESRRLVGALEREFARYREWLAGMTHELESAA